MKSCTILIATNCHCVSLSLSHCPCLCPTVSICLIVHICLNVCLTFSVCVTVHVSVAQCPHDVSWSLCLHYMSAWLYLSLCLSVTACLSSVSFIYFCWSVCLTISISVFCLFVLICISIAVCVCLCVYMMLLFSSVSLSPPACVFLLQCAFPLNNFQRKCYVFLWANGSKIKSFCNWNMIRELLCIVVLAKLCIDVILMQM